VANYVKDVHDYYRSCDTCQIIGGLATLNVAKLVTSFLEEPFMGLDFVVLIKLVGRYTINKYIFVAIDYATKWAKTRTLRTNIVVVTTKFYINAY